MSLSVDFTKASWTQSADGFALQLYVKNKPAVLRFLEQMQEKRTYTAELKEQRNRRSLDANAYCWVLLDKLAEATGVPKTELYRNALREIGGNTLVGCFQKQEAIRMASSWPDGHLGRMAEIGSSKLEGCVTLTLTLSSSEFDTAQMSRLIENIVQDCQAVGIETKTPDEIARLMSQWEDA